jgi:lactaldehyde dehydrogenase / glycolaldehyde dehydrogenase
MSASSPLQHTHCGDDLAVTNPATGQCCATVELASVAEVTAAVHSADLAQRAWRQRPAIERAECLRAMANALLAQTEAIATALAEETGKSLDDARAEVHYGAEIVRYHAEWARRIEGEIIPSDNPREKLFLHREPLGVVVALIPFNFPIYTLLRKVAPALITGNTVVMRPSNHTPVSALRLAQAVQAALPEGVLQMLVMDHPVCAHLCTQPAVRMITLTGSLHAGRQVLEYAKAHMARCSLELGGKTPAIVMADADLDRAAADIVRSRLSHCGQLCTAVERVLVDRRVHDALLDRLRQAMTAVAWGDRSVHPERMGPLVSAEARARVHAMVERAQDEGAVLEIGGTVPEGPGFFYPPTLLSACTPTMEIVREEVFGPVLALLPFEGAEEALHLANDHQYGLSSVLYTRDHALAQRFAAEIEAGELYINRTPADPYQGYHAGWRRSGIGGDDGKHGMLAFTQTRLVVMPY